MGRNSHINNGRPVVIGHEFGAVTGRPRRCGWFDAVALRRAVLHNSLSSLGVTKLDVLDGLDTLSIATGYRIVAGERPSAAAAAPFLECEPRTRRIPAGRSPPSHH
jgi:adenylosuccinate synthase